MKYYLFIFISFFTCLQASEQASNNPYAGMSVSQQREAWREIQNKKFRQIHGLESVKTPEAQVTDQINTIEQHDQRRRAARGNVGQEPASNFTGFDSW